MKIRTVRLLAKEGAFNVYKNKIMSFASLATVVATLFILGLLLLIIVNVTTNLEREKQELEITAFLDVNASVMEKEEIALYVEKNKAAGIVSAYRFETKEQTYENMKRDFKNDDLLQGITPATLPECYSIKLHNPETSDQFISQLKLYSGINTDWVTYPKDSLDKLSGMLRVFNYVTVIVLVVLMIVSVLLISNTIRLTVFARRKEIEIMKYVGALDWFIRLPFIVEGMILGFLGAFLSFLCTSQTYAWIKNGLNTIFTGVGLPNLKLIEFGPVALRVMVIYVIFGVSLGMIGSFMSVRKHLNV